MPSSFLSLSKTKQPTRDESLSDELVAFLPSALEIQEAPPNPAARKLAWSLLLLLMIAIAWACLGKVNIVATAEGKIIPGTQIKQVQPLEKGVIKNILVKEGDWVKQGQPLIELDTTITQADTQRLQTELAVVTSRLAVNEAFLKQLSSIGKTNSESSPDKIYALLPDLPDGANRQVYQQLLWQKWLEYRARFQTLQRGRDKAGLQQSVSKETIVKLEKTLPIITRRAERLKALYESNYASEVEYLETEQERITVFQDLAAERYRLQQTQATGQEIEQQLLQLESQTRFQVLTEITEQTRQLDVLVQELAKVEDTDSRKVLLAPVDGKVQNLVATTVGGVVTEAEQMMLIVPEADELIAEVFLENKDAGFVHEGMLSEIKVQTFPFTKYGIINAVVANVSNDAILDEQRGLLYQMRLTMNQSTVMVNDKPVQLKPGMSVTAEVRTGERRIIEFFLAPLMRHGSEAIRER